MQAKESLALCDEKASFIMQLEESFALCKREILLHYASGKSSYIMQAKNLRALCRRIILFNYAIASLGTAHFGNFNNHLGIKKCKNIAKEILFWPTSNKDIEVKNCKIFMNR